MSMARAYFFSVLFCVVLPAHSMEGVSEIAAAKAGVFHHLDASGRNSLAVSGASVALVWEDNRSGAPGCYLALKGGGKNGFHEFPFGQGECFEPAIAAFDADRFLLIWEDAGGVHAAIADSAGPGLPTRLAESGGQGAVIRHAEFGAHAAWSAPDGHWRRVFHAPLHGEGKQLRSGAARPVDTTPASDDRAKTWSTPSRISGNPTGKQAGDLGRGTGAMRPALATFGNRLAAAWLDKRDFLSGYDVYAALTGKDSLCFEKDWKAQDSFGDAIAQWHVAAAGNVGGDLVIAWDDDRDGTADIWLTRLTATGESQNYSENFTLPEASGPGAQSDPALALDAAGNLHLAWIDRDAAGMTRLRYLRWTLPPRD
jgi:hypothetical protein